MAACPSHGTAMITTSLRRATSSLAAPVTSTPAGTPGSAAISAADSAARSAEREPISTVCPARASR